MCSRANMVAEVCLCIRRWIARIKGSARERQVCVLVRIYMHAYSRVCEQRFDESSIDPS